MEVVYMGIISKIFNAVFNAILSPVFKFVSNLLETVLSWLFDAVLKPLLINVFMPLLSALVELLAEIFAGIIYSIYAEILELVDALQTAFNIFAGLQKVTCGSTQASLLEIVFRLPKIQQAVWAMVALSFVLMMLFAILGTLRSMAELGDEVQRPVSRVLKGVLSGMLKLFLIPVATLFAVTLSCQILLAVSTALGGNDSSLARTVFVISSLDASNQASYNVSGKVKDSDTAVTPDKSIGIEDSIRGPYYRGEKSYADKSQVEQDFKLARFDYFIGFAGAVFLIFVLAICLFSFLTRIIEVIILFVIAPLFASVIPLDDGEKFKAWQEMFVGKLFSGYGTVMAMQTYMLLCPAVMGGSIVFGEGSVEANYLIRLIFLLGGAWAVIKAGPSITQLLSVSAGMSEAETGRAAMAGTAFAMSAAGSAALAVGGKAVQAYRGRKSGSGEGNKASDERIAKRLASGSGGAGKDVMKAADGGLGSSLKAKGGMLEMADLSGAGKSGAEAKISGAGSGGEKEKLSGVSQSRAAGASAQKTGGDVRMGKGKARQTASFFGGRITANRTEGGKSYLGFNFGKKFRFGRNKDGTFSANFLGFGWREGKDGKVDKISIPFMRFKRNTADGKMKVARYRIPMAGLRFKRAEKVTTLADGTTKRELGSFYLSDSSIGGYKARYDQDTGRAETLSSFGTHYAKNADGEYVKTHTDLLGARIEYEKNTDGTYRVANVSAAGVEAGFGTDEKGGRQLESLKGVGGAKYFFKREHLEKGNDGT